MEDWEKAERIVKDVTGGRYTPGSGNKNTKGDVRSKDNLWMLEVKQTSKEVLTFENLWLLKLEKFRALHELCLVVFFELRGYPYFYEGPGSLDKSSPDWKTVSLLEDKLPEIILSSSGGCWVKGQWEDLYEF